MKIAWRVQFVRIFSALSLFVPAIPVIAKWIPDHTVVVILENKSAYQIDKNEGTPYLNFLAQNGAYLVQAYFAQTPYGVIPEGAKSYLPARPSQPNYLYLLSGNNQGILPAWFQSSRSPYSGTASNDQHGNVLDPPVSETQVGIANNLIPAALRPFTTPNLGAAIIEQGGTFASFSESLPYPSYDGPFDLNGTASNPDLYRRKHNPVINWVNLTYKEVPVAKQRFVLPLSANLGFANTHDPVSGEDYRGFALDAKGVPIGYDRLPTVSIVIPNEQDDAHSNSDAAADAWLVSHIKPYAEWAITHNSLLVITYDEDGTTDKTSGDPYKTGHHNILTIFYGPKDKVIPGHYDERVDHLNILSTILDRHNVLEKFKQDFQNAYPSTYETGAEFENLVPIKDVFGEGAPLSH